MVFQLIFKHAEFSVRTLVENAAKIGAEFKQGKEQMLASDEFVVIYRA